MAFFTMSACDRDEIAPEVEDFGYGYFPLQEGTVRTYHVERIEYDPTSLDSSTVHYELQERITEKFSDESGHTAYRVERYRRGDSTQSWRLDSIATEYRTATRAVRNLTNTPVVKLIFPLRANSAWDGNQMNSLAAEEYAVSGLDKGYTLTDQKYDLSRSYEKTLKVTHSDERDRIVSNDVRYELYAEGVGLIYRVEETFIYWQTYENVNVIGEGKIQSGHRSYQTLIDYSL